VHTHTHTNLEDGIQICRVKISKITGRTKTKQGCCTKACHLACKVLNMLKKTHKWAYYESTKTYKRGAAASPS